MKNISNFRQRQMTQLHASCTPYVHSKHIVTFTTHELIPDVQTDANMPHLSCYVIAIAIIIAAAAFNNNCSSLRQSSKEDVKAQRI